MRNGEQGWASDFPIREEIEDYAGRMRSFVINCHEGGLGFTVRAEEKAVAALATSSQPTVRPAPTARSAE